MCLSGHKQICLCCILFVYSHVQVSIFSIPFYVFLIKYWLLNIYILISECININQISLCIIHWWFSTEFVYKLIFNLFKKPWNNTLMYFKRYFHVTIGRPWFSSLVHTFKWTDILFWDFQNVLPPFACRIFGLSISWIIYLSRSSVSSRCWIYESLHIPRDWLRWTWDSDSNLKHWWNYRLMSVRVSRESFISIHWMRWVCVWRK
jgi:hypothetical protein